MTFPELLQQRGIPFKQSYSDSNELTLRCPFCNDTKFRLGINIKSGYGHCFNGGCDYKSRRALKTLVKKLELGELTAYVAEEKKEEPRDLELPKDFQLLYRHDDDPLIEKARKYVLKRGVSKEQIKSKGIGVSLTGRFAYRVLFTVIEDETLLYMVGRDFTGEQEPKYLNTPGSKPVYNVPEKRHGAIVLSEGIFKCLMIEKVCEVPSGALLGHSVTERQLDMIEGFKEIVLWPDPDLAGLQGFIKMAIRLSGRYKLWLPEVIPTKQADEMSESEIKKVANSFKPWTMGLEYKYRSRVLELKDEE